MNAETAEAEARFDAAAARFRSVGVRWQHLKTRLDRAASRGRTAVVRRLRQRLDAIDLEVDEAREALHDARRALCRLY